MPSWRCGALEIQREVRQAAQTGHEDRIALWLRKLIAWQEEMADSGEMLDEVRSQVFDDRVYVFTPKGDVVDLPAAPRRSISPTTSTAMSGHRCIGAKIGGRIVPFTYQLQMGDQIEIITQKQPNPSRDWLNPNLGYVTTSRGRSKSTHGSVSRIVIRTLLPVARSWTTSWNIGISLKEAEKLCCRVTTFNELDELLAAIGGGDIRLNQLVELPASAVQQTDCRSGMPPLKSSSSKPRRKTATRTTAVWW